MTAVRHASYTRWLLTSKLAVVVCSYSKLNITKVMYDILVLPKYCYFLHHTVMTVEGVGIAGQTDS